MTIERKAAADAVPGDMLPGRMARLVADGLKARGFGVDLPEHEDRDWFCVERWGGRCELSVSDFGVVEWQCVPWAGNGPDGPDPALTADIVSFLLTRGDENYQCRHSGRKEIPFMGIAGNELKARGFSVGLDIYESDPYFEVSADLRVTNPVADPDENIVIDEVGLIVWKCDYPSRLAATDQEYLAVLANPGELAYSIVDTISHAISLSSGTAARRTMDRGEKPDGKGKDQGVE